MVLPRCAGLVVAQALLPVSIFLAAIVSLPAQQPDGKLPLPDKAAQDRAMKLVRELYGQKYKDAETPADKRALAETLLQEADKSRDDPPSQFVLLRVARDVAVGTGDVKTTLAAVEQMAGRFQVDGLAMKADVVPKLNSAARFSSQKKAVATAALAIVDEAVAGERYDVALRVAKAALAAARDSRDSAIRRKAEERRKQVETLAKAHAEFNRAMATLQTRPGDAVANLVAGKYLCLTRGDWKAGVLMLALGTDPKLKSLARTELEGPGTGDAMVALADGWWECAEDATGEARNQFQWHAADWYRRASRELKGLARTKVETRLKEIAALAGTSAPPGVKPSGPDSAAVPRPAAIQDASLAGTYELLESEAGQTTKTVKMLLRFSADGKVYSQDGTAVATWREDGKQIAIKHLDPKDGIARLDKRAGGELAGTLQLGGQNTKSWTLRRIWIVAVWELNTGTGGYWRTTLFSNGKVDDPAGDKTWSLNGTELQIGTTVLNILSDGRSLGGRGTGGGGIYGRLISRNVDIDLGPLPKDASGFAQDEPNPAQPASKREAGIAGTFELSGVTSNGRKAIFLTLDFHQDNKVLDHGKKVGAWQLEGAQLKIDLDYDGAGEIALRKKSNDKFGGRTKWGNRDTWVWSLDRVVPAMVWAITHGNSTKRHNFYSNGRIGTPHAVSSSGYWVLTKAGIRVWEAECKLSSGGRAFTGRRYGGGYLNGKLLSAN